MTNQNRFQTTHLRSLGITLVAVGCAGSPGGVGTGGSAAIGGGTSQGGAGGLAGTGGSVNCACVRGAYVPVCGTDGKTYDAACGDVCVPVAIQCRGQCPCPAGSGGTAGTTTSPCGVCASGDICIYQNGGPGPSHYACATRLPCGAMSLCACIQNQGTCSIAGGTSGLGVQCICDNGLR